VPFDSTHPGYWIIASAAFAIVATNLLWLVLHVGRVTDVALNDTWAPLRWLATALFFGLPPIFAWRSGALSPYLAGLAELDWPGALTRGLLLALIAAAVALAGWVGGQRGRAIAAAQDERPPGWRVPFDATLLQIHWTFYRAGAAGALILASDHLPLPDLPLMTAAGQALMADPLYWGCWLGLGLAGLEWLLNPIARRVFGSPGGHAYTLLRLALALVTTGIFVATRNFWLTLAVHLVVELLAASWQPHIHRDTSGAQTNAQR
jgi:hypothetical protein